MEIVTIGSQAFATGWTENPVAAAESLARIEVIQGFSPYFEQTLAGSADSDDSPVHLWDAEIKLYGSMRKSWNQKQVGSCVAFGNGRGADDLIKNMAALGVIEDPGADVATEPIYGGSRVEVGGGRIGGDGSVGAWAAEWLLKWGLLLRKQYGSHDLREYSESKCRDYGRRGCPDDLEPEAKLYPVKGVALVTSKEQAWKSLGSGYPIAVCSNRGFTTVLKDGFCEPSGTWNHCMVIRGRMIAKKGSKVVRAYACQNSWADYLQGVAEYIDGLTGEVVKIPEGCFLMEESVLDYMLSQRDSYALSDASGFKKRKISWIA